MGIIGTRQAVAVARRSARLCHFAFPCLGAIGLKRGRPQEAELKENHRRARCPRSL